jgi:DivIVA domain-containing protein
MDSPKSSSQQSSLDSLRTVEFRQTLRGYHIDDVDEYLERVAVDAEALHEQVRQSNDRMRQAAERIAQLEQVVDQLQHELEAARTQTQAAPAPDETLQRTLLLAQKFVDQTEAEAEAQARSVLAEAEARARTMLADAEGRARALTEETERHLREDITRLESIRTQLAGDVETIATHLETERSRLRNALGDMLSWVDQHVQPAASLLAQPPPPPPPPMGAPTAGDSASAEVARVEDDDAGGPPTMPSMRPVGGMPVDQPAGGPREETGEAAVEERQQTMPLSDSEDVRAGVPH